MRKGTRENFCFLFFWGRRRIWIMGISEYNFSKRPSAEAFRKARWIRRKRGLIGFFLFLGGIVAILFFDYYMVAVSKFFAARSAKEIEERAGKYVRLSDRERQEMLDGVKKLLASGRIEEARVNILRYLEKESTAEGNYIAALVYIRQGDVHSAYRYLKESLKINPNNYEARQQLSELYLAVGDLKSAQEEAAILK